MLKWVKNRDLTWPPTCSMKILSERSRSSFKTTLCLQNWPKIGIFYSHFDTKVYVDQSMRNTAAMLTWSMAHSLRELWVIEGAFVIPQHKICARVSLSFHDDQHPAPFLASITTLSLTPIVFGSHISDHRRLCVICRLHLVRYSSMKPHGSAWQSSTRLLQREKIFPVEGIWLIAPNFKNFKVTFWCCWVGMFREFFAENQLYVLFIWKIAGRNFSVKVWANTILTESSPELSHGGLILRTLS